MGLLLGAKAAAQTPEASTAAPPLPPLAAPPPQVAPAEVPPALPATPTPSPGPPPSVLPAQETLLRVLPGSPPPGPSTLGNPFVDARNVRLSQGLFGGLGTLNVSSADIGGAGILRFAAYGQYYTNTGWPLPGDGSTHSAGTFAVDYVALDWLELYASYSATSTHNTGSDSAYLASVGNAGLGAKASLRLSPLFALAVDVRASRLPGVATPDVSEVAYTLSPYLLFAWTPPIPLRLGVQFGAQFQWDNVPLSESGSIQDQIAFGRTAYNQLLFGISLEFPIPVVTPFVEYTTGLPLNVYGNNLIGANGSSLPLHSGLPHQLNVGLKVSAIQNLTFLLAGQFSLQGNVSFGVPAIPPWNFVFAATYAVDVFPVPPTRVVGVPVVVEPVPSTGTVVGVVRDAATAQPLGAVVVGLVAGSMAPVASDAVTGEFVTRPLPPGATQLRLQKDGYQEAWVPTTVEAGKATTLQASLNPLVKRSRFLLTTTAHTKPVAATVKFSGTEAKVVETKADALGPTEVLAKPGAYLAEVTAVGYLAQVREVEVSAGAELQLAFELQPEPKRRHVVLRDDKLELLVQVHFTPGRATLLPDTYPLLDEVVDAVVRFGIKRVRVEGYTDSSGTRAVNLRLSQARAEAVLEYLAQKGIPRSRLEAKGYGDTHPIAPNLTARGRELNRRVEIVVLEK
jgi:OmpA-OmpF porin, OOP family